MPEERGGWELFPLSQVRKSGTGDRPSSFLSLSLSLSNAEPCYTLCLCCGGAAADCGTGPVCKELQSRKLDGAQVTLTCPSAPIPHPAHEGSASTASGVVRP